MRRLLVIGLTAAALAACSGEPVEQWPPVKVYTVRGEVASMPPADQPKEWLGVRHEAIPDFIGITGEPDPMRSMTMQFTLDESVDADALAVGDKISFLLEVDWSADHRARLIEIQPLPPETELDFGGD